MQDHRNLIMQNQSQETRNLLVISDLADNVNDNDIKMFFEKFQDSILVIQNNRWRSENNGSKMNSATLVFKDFKDADKARLELNMRKLKGRTVRITWHERDSSIRYQTHLNLYIKNIPSHVTPRQFYEYMLQFGDIVSAKMSENEEGDHLGYGYIHFSNIDSLNKCLEACNDVEVWKGSKLSIEKFQKKNERNQMNPNTFIFIKNFPQHYEEKQLKDLFTGLKLNWAKIMEDNNKRKSAFLCFNSEEDTIKAKTLNGKIIEGVELFVDTLMNKNDRKRYLTNKINDQIAQLSFQFKDCNLHVKNLPLNMKENELKLLFSKFGDVKSVKIQSTLTCTKVKNEFVETQVSSGFGFVCFTNPDSARLAIEELNGQLLKEFPDHKKPLEINFFMPKNERKQVLNHKFYSHKQLFDDKKNDFMDNMFNSQPLTKNFKHQELKNQGISHHQKQVNKQQHVSEKVNQDKGYEEPDYSILKNFEDDSSKKDYLGEFIFKKIEWHELTESNRLTLDQVGKITGMILGIEDVNEIVDICRNHDHLTSRISEALELLHKAN